MKPVEVMARAIWQNTFGVGESGALVVAEAALDALKEAGCELLEPGEHPAEPQPEVWIRFADNGNIRKWSAKPFEGATRYRSLLSTSEQEGGG